MDSDKNNVISLTSFKKNKTTNHVVDELKELDNILNRFQNELLRYKHFVLAQELISVLQTNKSILSMNRLKYERQMEEDAKKHP